MGHILFCFFKKKKTNGKFRRWLKKFSIFFFFFYSISSKSVKLRQGKQGVAWWSKKTEQERDKKWAANACRRWQKYKKKSTETPFFLSFCTGHKTKCHQPSTKRTTSNLTLPSINYFNNTNTTKWLKKILVCLRSSFSNYAKPTKSLPHTWHH